MVCRNPGCIDNFDLDHIVFFAKKRYLEGYDTVTLLAQAGSEQEKKEIALVCLLDVEDEQLQSLQMSCCDESQCKIAIIRENLKKIIDLELKVRQQTGPGGATGHALTPFP